MGKRLQLLATDRLKLAPTDLANALGMKTRSSLLAAFAGKGFLDPDRLVILATLKDEDARTPNLHWLLTGQGEPMIGGADVAPKELDVVRRWLNPTRLQALRTLTQTQLG